MRESVRRALEKGKPEKLGNIKEVRKLLQKIRDGGGDGEGAARTWRSAEPSEGSAGPHRLRFHNGSGQTY